MTIDYIEANRIGRERLSALVKKLSIAELETETGDGWTVSAILAHMAFWDLRVIALMRRWAQTEVGQSPVDVDILNDATKPLCLAIPARKAARLVIQTAEAVDTELENMPEALKPEIDQLVQTGMFRIDRSQHRHEHIDQIIKILDENKQEG